MEIVDPPVSGDLRQHTMPKIDMSGNKWLRELITGQGHATIHDLYQSSMEPRMRNFWVGDLASGSDYCGGGLMCLAHVAFQQTNGGRLNNSRIPSFEESKWQFLYLVLHHMTTDKQRHLVSFLIGALLPHMKPGDFFKETSVPRHRDGETHADKNTHRQSHKTPTVTLSTPTTLNQHCDILLALKLLTDRHHSDHGAS